MIRSFAISLCIHGMLILTFLMMAILPPPVKEIKPIEFDLQAAGGGGGGGAAPPPEPSPLATPEQQLPTPVPTMVPTVAPTPEPTIEATPTPEETPEIIRPNKTPEATPTPKATVKSTLRPTPKPTATPAPTPRPTPKPTITALKAPKKTVVNKVKVITNLSPTPAATPVATPGKTIVVPQVPGPAARQIQVPVAPRPGIIAPVAPGQGGAGNSGLAIKSRTGQTSIGIGDGTGTGDGTGAGSGPGGLGATYSGRVLAMIEANFHRPSEMDVQAVLRFTILKDGTISPESIAIVKTSGYAHMDQAARRALLDTGKLPPLYEGFSQNQLTVNVTFDFKEHR